MANVPISGLDAGANVQSTDLFPDVQVPGVGPVKVTAAQIKTFMSDNPTFVNPNIGVAHGTSLALGGATIGTNSLAVTGTSNLSSVSAISLALGGASIGSNVFSAFGNVEISGDITQDNGSLYLGIQQASQGSIVLANTSAGTYPTTIKSSNFSTSATTYTLPTSDGTSGYVLSTDGAGNLSWIDSATIVAGTTPTSGFTAGQILISDGSKIQPAGDAIATSIALNGATLGANKLAISGSSLFSGNVVQDTGSATFGVQQTTQGEIILANTAAGNYSTHIKSSNNAIESWTLTLPVSKGANGYVLSTNGAGVSSWIDPTTLVIDIDVNTTAITGGTTGHLVYDNAGTFGEISAITTDGVGGLTLGTQQTTQGSIILANTAAGAFPTVIESSNLSSASWTLTLPPTAGTNKYVLTTDGSGTSSWSRVDLTAGVSGVLPAANGGTGNATNTIHGVLIGNAGNAINSTSAGSAGQLLTSGGAASDPVWTTAVYPSSTTINQILYSDSNNNVTGLTTANGGIVNTNSSGVPSVTVNPTLGVQQTTQGSIILANTAAGAFSTTLKSSNLSSEAWSLTLPTSKGSSGYVLTTDGTGTSSWTSPTSLGIDIDINSTAITSGTTGRLLYDNAATVGEVTAITTNGSATLTIGAQQTTQGSVVLANTAAGAFSTTIKSSNSSSAAWSLTLPTTAGTANYWLITDGSGNTSWTNSIAVATGTSLALGGATIGSNALAVTGTSQFSSSCRFGSAVTPANTVDITGSFGRGAPVTKNADFAVGATDNWIINNKAGSSCIVTLPAAATWIGREITIMNYQAQTVDSVASNVVPSGGGAAGTAILSGSAGKWATLVSDGSNWIIMANN